MATLYLEAESLSSQDGNEEILKCSSAVCLFVYNVLIKEVENSLCSVVLVVTNKKCDSKEQSYNEILKLENGHSFTQLLGKDCPKNVQYCELPILVTSEGNMMHCGLCSVVRKLVKMVHLSVPKRKLIRLLGHHEMCLRACSEVSVWTKFCEVEMPLLVQELHQSLESQVHTLVPPELVKLEQHMQQPAVIPQIGKRKKKIFNILTSKENKTSSIPEDDWIENMNLFSLKTFMDNSSGGKKHIESEILDVLTSNKKLCSNVNIPGLDHVFAEGADITLTDLVLFPSVSCILHFMLARDSQMVKQIPHVLDWYNRFASTDIMKKAALKVGIPLLNINYVKPDLKNEVTGPFVTSCDNKLVKQKLKVSTAEAGKVLSSLKGIDLSTRDNLVYSDSQCKIEWSQMPASVHPAKGNLPGNRISRKCEQLENLALTVQSIAKPGQIIVDFCAGGGHLGILLAHILPECHIVLVENKEESITRAELRVQELELKNITLCQSNLDYFKGTFDIGICLHACGVATDLVLDKCLKVNASFVVCPCCYGGVQNTHTLRYPKSQHYKEQISYEDFLLLTRAADDEKTGKTFMIAVDEDRVKHTEEQGYKVTLCSLKPLTCSPKNNLLIGVKC